MGRKKRWGYVRPAWDAVAPDDIEELADSEHTILLKVGNKVVAWARWESGGIPGGGCSGSWRRDEQGAWYSPEVEYNLRVVKIRRPKLWRERWSSTCGVGDVYTTTYVWSKESLIFPASEQADPADATPEVAKSPKNESKLEGIEFPAEVFFCFLFAGVGAAILAVAAVSMAVPSVKTYLEAAIDPQVKGTRPEHVGIVGILAAAGAFIFLLAILAGTREESRRYLVGLALRKPWFRVGRSLPCVVLSLGGAGMCLVFAWFLLFTEEKRPLTAVVFLCGAVTMLWLAWMWLCFTLGTASSRKRVKKWFRLG